jgi:hypothetical protein
MAPTPPNAPTAPAEPGRSSTLRVVTGSQRRPWGRAALIIAGTGLFLSVAASSAAEPEPPRVPYIARSVCPFEGCDYGTWMARSPVRAYKAEGDTSMAAFTLSPQERFQALRGNVHVVKLGEVLMRRPLPMTGGRTLRRGDQVHVLAYRGEGRYELWHQGARFTAPAFWPPFVPMERPPAEIVTWPEMFWWVLIKAPPARQGWLRLRNVSRSGFEFNEDICTGPC